MIYQLCIVEFKKKRNSVHYIDVHYCLCSCQLCVGLMSCVWREYFLYSRLDVRCFFLSAVRSKKHAQHRHSVVSHSQLGLQRQHAASEEQAERAAHQLHPVLTAAPGQNPRAYFTRLSVKRRTASDDYMVFIYNINHYIVNDVTW